MSIPIGNILENYIVRFSAVLPLAVLKLSQQMFKKSKHWGEFNNMSVLCISLKQNVEVYFLNTKTIILKIIC